MIVAILLAYAAYNLVSAWVEAATADTSLTLSQVLYHDRRDFQTAAVLVITGLALRSHWYLAIPALLSFDAGYNRALWFFIKDKWNYDSVHASYSGTWWKSPFWCKIHWRPWHDWLRFVVCGGIALCIS